MKSNKKLLYLITLLSILIICSLAAFLTACADKTPVTGITLNKTNLTIMEGQTFKLEAKIQPSDASDKKVKWSVTQPADFVRVSEDGTVTALTTGAAVVTAKSGKISASCNVLVIPLSPTGIELNTKSIVLDKDGSYKLRATIKPNGAPGTVAFTSDNTAVATVGAYDGTVTAKSMGETVVKAHVGGYTGTIIAECKVRVGYKITVKTEGNGEIDYNDKYYYSGSSISLTATADKGHIFDGWYQNGTRISTKTSYSFKVAGDAEITAKFIEDPKAPKMNEDGWYEIENYTHLVWATQNPFEDFVLKNNITITDSSFKGFAEFNGWFDGKGHTITGFKAGSDNYADDSGFFNELDGTVKNLTLKNADYSGKNSDAGLLAGGARGATIENCTVSGSINIKSMDDQYCVGGLVGSASNTVIKNCSVDVTVSIDEYDYGYFGGLVGYTGFNCQFSHSGAKVKTEITYSEDKHRVHFGGLIGCVSADCRSISCCWADIDAEITILSNYLRFGGLIGSNPSKFDNCYTTGSLTVKIPANSGNNENGIYVGGMIGDNFGTVEKCYSAVDINLSGNATLQTGYVAGFCGDNSGSIGYSVYCGHFTANGEVANCTKPFAYTTSDGDTDNAFYVRDWYFGETTNYNGTLLSTSLNKQFFIALEFWESVWKYDNNNSLPHF